MICLISAPTPPRDLGLPVGRVRGTPPRGQGDVPAGLPEGPGEGTGALPQDLHPDVGEELPGGDRRPGPGRPEEGGDRHPEAGAQAPRQRHERDPGWAQPPGRRGGGYRTEDGVDEVASAQDPCIGLDWGPGATRGARCLPPAEAPDEAAPLELRAPPLRDPRGDKGRYARRARRGLGPNWARMVAVSCQGRETVPRRALWPVQGERARVGRSGRTLARSGLRWR